MARKTRGEMAPIVEAIREAVDNGDYVSAQCKKHRITNAQWQYWNAIIPRRRKVRTVVREAEPGDDVTVVTDSLNRIVTRANRGMQAEQVLQKIRELLNEWETGNSEE